MINGLAPCFLGNSLSEDNSLSLVHLSYKKVVNDDRECYEVFCPDFNKEFEREIIGSLYIDIKEKSYNFEIISKFKNEFCPPEYFIKFSGDTKQVENACNEEGLYYMFWSLAIHKKALKLMNEEET